MNRTLAIAVILGSLVLAPISAQGKQVGGGGRQRLTVTVCDLSKAGTVALRAAEEATTRIFRSSDIDLDWMETKSKRCVLPLNPGFTVIIIPRSADIQRTRDVMGKAIPEVGRAYIFMDLVKVFIHSFERTESDDKAAGMILGHAIAHELGHLLIAGEGHSQSGIMSTAWHYVQWTEASQGRLLFHPNHAAMMRDRLHVQQAQIRLK